VAVERVDDLLSFGEKRIRSLKRSSVLALHQVPRITFWSVYVCAAFTTMEESNIDPAIAASVAVEDFSGITTDFAPLRDEFRREPVTEVDSRWLSVTHFGQPFLSEFFVARKRRAGSGRDSRVSRRGCRSESHRRFWHWKSSAEVLGFGLTKRQKGQSRELVDDDTAER
jgi:hypothetical protein